MIGKGSEKKHPVKLCNQANFFCRVHNAILNQRCYFTTSFVKPPVQTRGVTLKPPLLNPPLLNRPFKLC